MLVISKYDTSLSLYLYANPQKSHRCTSVRQHRNCKRDDVCTGLNHLFLCEDGLCQNITDVFSCSYERAKPPLDCTDKRNCITLQGLYDCRKGMCSQV